MSNEFEWITPLDEFLTKTDDNVKYLVYPFIPEGEFTLISGQQKLAGKTYFAYMLAWIAASGEAWGVFEPDKESKVLIVQEESSAAENKLRFQAIARGLGYSQEKWMDIAKRNILMSFSNRVKMDDEMWVEKLKRAATHFKPDMVIFDVFNELHTGDENRPADVNKVIECMKVVRKAAPASATVLLTHLKKYDDAAKFKRMDRDNQVRGSSALPGAYGMHLALRRYDDSDKHIKLLTRGKGVESEKYTVSWDFEHEVVMVKDKPRPKLFKATPDIHIVGRESDDMSVMIEKYRHHCTVGALYNAKDLKTTWGVSLTTARNLAAAMVQDGLMVETNKKQHWVFTIKPS